MSAIPIEVEGTVREDGTLELDQKVNLPPGRVKVTVRPATPPVNQHEAFLAMLQQIRTSQEASGPVPRSAEEIDAEIKAFRDEVDEHFLAVERLQEEAAKARRQDQSSGEPAE
jgi:hypothetical protein